MGGRSSDRSGERTGTAVTGSVTARSLASVPAPSRIATPQRPETAAESVLVSLGAETTWDSVMREVYNKGSAAIRQQAQELYQSGQMTAEQAKIWANGQRNALLQACRDESTPIGRAVAQMLKPGPKTVADLEALGKSAEGIIESAGRTNPYVNRVAFGFRYAGPAMMIIALGFSAYHIATAPDSERWQVVAQEAGLWAGALAGGWAGGAAGCKVGGAIGTAPEPGGGTAAGCLVGTVVGGLAGAVAGGWAGSKAGDYVYRSVAIAAPVNGGSRRETVGHNF